MTAAASNPSHMDPSMKVPPKRKGNRRLEARKPIFLALNESPSEKEGKSPAWAVRIIRAFSLNESPSEKEGKYDILSTRSQAL